jgi:UDP-glucose 4-epimerase
MKIDVHSGFLCGGQAGGRNQSQAGAAIPQASVRKDFIYYTDMTAAVEAIIEQELTGTFNISAGKSYSIREVAADIERLTERQVNLTCSP